MSRKSKENLEQCFCFLQGKLMKRVIQIEKRCLHSLRKSVEKSEEKLEEIKIELTFLFARAFHKLSNF